MNDVGTFWKQRCALWGLASAAVFTSVSCGAASNPLIGSWRLAGETPNRNMPGVHCQITRMDFTASSTTSYDPEANPAIAVRYLANARRVVVTSQGGDVIYDVIDADHVQREDWFKCLYVRQR